MTTAPTQSPSCGPRLPSPGVCRQLATHDKARALYPTWSAATRLDPLP